MSKRPLLPRGTPAAPPPRKPAAAPEELPKETWRAFLVFGLGIPLHLYCGLSLTALIAYKLLLLGLRCGLQPSAPECRDFLLLHNPVFFTLLLLYLPLWLYPAHKRLPGWKGAEAFWEKLDYGTSGPNYCGSYEVRCLGEDLGMARRPEGALIVPGPPDPAGQYIVALHPHGAIVQARSFFRVNPRSAAPDSRCNVYRYLSRDWRCLAASALFWIPVVREMTLWFGAVDAGRETFEKVLKRGFSLLLWPGGITEQNETLAAETDSEGNLKKQVIWLKPRRGFVRLAVKNRVPIVPAFVFGEEKVVRAVRPLPEFVTRVLEKRLRVSTTLWLGRWNNIAAFRVPMRLCLGRALDVGGGGGADGEALVERVFEAYKAELRAIFDFYKEEFGYAGTELGFVD